MRKPKMPIICIIGSSDSGKTTIIEKLIPEFKKRGYNIGTIKHCPRGFEIDIEGKDSWRHRKAGASFVCLSSPEKIAFVKNLKRDLSLEDIVKKFAEDVDLIIAEGFKESSYPKIGVYSEIKRTDVLKSKKGKFFALISDEKLNLEVPTFGFDHLSSLVDLIIKKFL